MRFSKIFVGIPLSQYKNSNVSLGTAEPLIKDIMLTMEEFNPSVFTLSRLRHLPKSEPHTQLFFSWIEKNKELLDQAGYDFHYDYSKKNEYAVIFGKYLDIDTKPTGLKRYISHANLIEDECLNFFNIINSMPEEVLQIFDENQLIGAFENEHSD